MEQTHISSSSRRERVSKDKGCCSGDNDEERDSVLLLFLMVCYVVVAL